MLEANKKGLLAEALSFFQIVQRVEPPADAFAPAEAPALIPFTVSLAAPAAPLAAPSVLDAAPLAVPTALPAAPFAVFNASVEETPAPAPADWPAALAFTSADPSAVAERSTLSVARPRVEAERSSTRPRAPFVLFSIRPLVLPMAPVMGPVLGPLTAPPTLPPRAPPNCAKLGVALSSAIAPIPAKKANFRICLFSLVMKSRNAARCFQAERQRAGIDSEPRSFRGTFVAFPCRVRLPFDPEPAAAVIVGRVGDVAAHLRRHQLRLGSKADGKPGHVLLRHRFGLFQQCGALFRI